MRKEQDFALGRETENELSLYFLDQGFWVRSTRCLGACPFYDLIIHDSKNIYKIEIKTDNAAHATGNVVIEYARLMSGKLVMAGISTTRSEYYIFKIKKTGELLVCRTEELKQLLRDNWNTFERKHEAGRDNVSSLILIPLKSLRPISKPLEGYFKITL